MMTTPISDFVKKYGESGAARFHMPGHKGKDGLFADITEIIGADELYAADGIIEESENNASELFGSLHSYYSAEGSTLAIKTMLTLAAEERPCGERPLFVAARNVHKSFVYGAAMLDADVVWIYSEDEHVCKCRINALQVEKAIKACRRKPDGVYVTSPDYLGNIADIGGIADVCDKFGVPLLVDNAHGAYLAFCEKNIHPLALGASMCADSAHKTLPVLTGGAYLHVAKKAERFCGAVRRTMAIYGSTSPSYLILRSLDECNRYISESGERRKIIADFVERIRSAFSLQGVVFEGDEPQKLTVNAPQSGYTGEQLANFFRHHGIEPEFCDADYIVFMLSEFNSDDELKKLWNAFCNLKKKLPLPQTYVKISPLQRKMSIREAVLAPSEIIPVELAENMICASPTVSCPPAVPIAVSGEVIDTPCIQAFLHYGITQVCVVKD